MEIISKPYLSLSDMRSSNYEAALTRFEARIGSAQLSDVVRGLVSVIRGDGGASLSVNTGSYICKTPVPPLPVIISDGESLFADID